MTGPSTSAEHDVPEVVLYTTDQCSYCVRAKRLLARKGVAWREVNLDREPERQAEVLERSGGRKTMPQVFIGRVHVGGFEELSALERAGELDALLGR